MAAEDSTQSRLLALPRELRDEIYILTFKNGGEPIRVDSVPMVHRTVTRLNADLCLASKQLYAETIALHYKHTPFHFRWMNEGILHLKSIPHKYHETMQEVRLVSHKPPGSDIQKKCFAKMVEELEKNSIKLNRGVIRGHTGYDGNGQQIWTAWPFDETQ